MLSTITGQAFLLWFDNPYPSVILSPTMATFISFVEQEMNNVAINANEMSSLYLMIQAFEVRQKNYDLKVTTAQKQSQINLIT